MGKRYVSPQQRAEEALGVLWNAAIEMCGKSRIGWGDRDDGDPEYEDAMLTFAKLIYGFICENGPDGMSDADGMADDQARTIASEAFQEMVDRLGKQDGNIVALPTTA